ncbi:MAG: VPLPA-CTERM sorting domain-containing protein [Pseudomonadota bacterium]
MIKLKHVAVALAIQVAAVTAAQASTFTVEQYLNFVDSTPTLAEMEAHAANTTADYTTLVDVIDFTDDPNGFAGAIPGSSPWPAETATGQSGTSSSVNNTFMARITAIMNVASPDTFTFRTFNDDGVFVLVDGDLVINDPTYHPEAQFSGQKALQAGAHSIEIFFFENGGEASLEFSIADSSGNFSLDGGGIVSPVPLPSSVLMLAAGLGGLAAMRRRKAKAAAA